MWGVRVRGLPPGSPPGRGTCAGCAHACATAGVPSREGDLCGVCMSVLPLGSPPGRGQGPQGADEARKAQSAVLLVGSRGRPGAGWAPRGGRNVSGGSGLLGTQDL